MRSRLFSMIVSRFIHFRRNISGWSYNNGIDLPGETLRVFVKAPAALFGLSPAGHPNRQKSPMTALHAEESQPELRRKMENLHGHD